MTRDPQIYVIAHYARQPNDPGSTRFPGYMKDQANTNYKEQVTVARKIKNRDYSSAGVILDAINRKVIKCSWNSGASFTELWDYFSKNYPNYMKPIEELLNPTEPVQTVVGEQSTVEAQTTVTSPSGSSINT
jgi:hypothetical protein